MNVDYLIIGQGITGTFLSRDLLRAGKTVCVIDEGKPFTASKVASGVINPITGRRLVRTWEIEKLMPYAVKAYKEWENTNGSLVRQCNILDFHPTPQMVMAFAERQPIEKEYLKTPADTDRWRNYFNYHFSIGEIDPCWLIDINTLLETWRAQLLSENNLLETTFKWEDCKVEPDHITWNNITAGKIICCEGVAGFENPWFRLLPYARNKGQAIIASIPGLPRTNIYKQGINIVPWKEDLFWIGSTYEWDFSDTNPSADFRKKVEEQLRHWLRIPFEIVDHMASERPANMERRPFAGLHPVMPSVGVFNGMGTKGCSLTPYFSNEFTNHLLHQAPLSPQVDVRRFTKILGRAV
ncbi:FAD-binding oxidoreductase [Sediminibacterium roseum]|uniref:FAD-binding oxidoreductase n=1 Tax=Sediminibacterium roseum TaxID=1978412 RepID=A0ABW9ZW51_9BACT|nr:FAD-dependent oxidoreductase [Sediminibacterium roseum]NCI49280.1 FAD-binding oxidoreductase [Sediminibacterium roseum]